MNAARSLWGIHSTLDPFGPAGPLGESGPLTAKQIYQRMPALFAEFGANHFAFNLDITGVWGILGVWFTPWLTAPP